jgi:hypothetical protein
LINARVARTPHCVEAKFFHGYIIEQIEHAVTRRREKFKNNLYSYLDAPIAPLCTLIAKRHAICMSLR